MAKSVVPERDYPQHKLEELCAAVNSCRIMITDSALEGAWDAGLDAPDIAPCLEQLTPADFHKSQQHEAPGFEHVWLDIYRPRYRERDLCEVS